MEDEIYTESRTDRKDRIVKRGNTKGFDWFVVSLDTHPTAYIALPKSHPYFGVDDDDIKVLCHGGITFSDNGKSFAKSYKIEDDSVKKSFVIGWDYAHCGDYTEFSLDKKGYKWTVSEIEQEINEVIEQLLKTKKFEFELKVTANIVMVGESFEKAQKELMDYYDKYLQKAVNEKIEVIPKEVK